MCDNNKLNRPNPNESVMLPSAERFKPGQISDDEVKRYIEDVTDKIAGCAFQIVGGVRPSPGRVKKNERFAEQ